LLSRLVYYPPVARKEAPSRWKSGLESFEVHQRLTPSPREATRNGIAVVPSPRLFFGVTIFATGRCFPVKLSCEATVERRVPSETMYLAFASNDNAKYGRMTPSRWFARVNQNLYWRIAQEHRHVRAATARDLGQRLTGSFHRRRVQATSCFGQCTHFLDKSVGGLQVQDAEPAPLPRQLAEIAP
jgi:hypothetical protein